ncbi:hypothetical protein BH11MYX3_BH11MYX3_36890 [soil metagenome]
MRWLPLLLLRGCGSARSASVPLERPSPVRDEVVDDIADWGLRKSKVARFAAQKP